ncbi:unnamed protein product [Mycena citricolor]|uniref:PPM-type phosphatase domain-containing protein n=1 Tax=Mycena citricolor TaxID=2018698 RepID=A0AAD2GV78_9AGAR|nr:unnamed protein product [Mycena citricolor]
MPYISAPGLQRPVHNDTGTRQFEDQRIRRLDTTVLRPGEAVLRQDFSIWQSHRHCTNIFDTDEAREHGWSIWALYDDYSGDQTTNFLVKYLTFTLIRNLERLYRGTLGEHHPTLIGDDSTEPEVTFGAIAPDAAQVHSEIKDLFLQLDQDIVELPVEQLRKTATEEPSIYTMSAMMLQEAHSGSRALLSFFEARPRRLHVSNIGTSRAVLGRRRPGQDLYDVHVLSAEHTAGNASEVARISALHPGEEGLFEGGKFMGWDFTRAFGHGAMKWARDAQQFLYDNYMGDKPMDRCKTPPYLTAEPETTTVEIQSGDFLIVASHGLWDCLTSEEAVGLIGLWLDTKRVPLDSFDLDTPRRKFYERTDLPVRLADNETHYRTWRVKKRFVNVDGNAAWHLTRNATGGANVDVHAALTEIGIPRSGMIRDDIGVIVTFFE